MKNLKYFGRKFTIKDTPNLAPSWKNKEFCLLGLCDNAIAFIEWDKRGEYHCEFATFHLDDIKFLDNK